MSSRIPESEKFATAARPKPMGQQIQVKGDIPGERANTGDRVSVTVTASDGSKTWKIKLKKKFAQGGEGSIFSTNVSGHVAKVYQRDKITKDRLEKITLMMSRPIKSKGICFPVALLYNDRDEFVGYLMPEAKGVELSRSVFVPQLLLQKFPNWTREHTIQLCITILKKIKYLNDRGVILGDINPSNILVVSPQEIYLVDCDSYQIGAYPCPVGTAHFTPAEVAGRDFKTFLRTQEMENFAIATLLFMIMLPGKAPYSAVGGTSPAQNIKDGNFPYEGDGDSLPPGKWGFIWNHMSFRTRQAFYQVFKKGEPHFAPNKRLSTAEWIRHFQAYLHAAKYMLQNDPMAMDIFPTRPKMKECVEEGCDNRFVPSKANVYLFCDDHVRKPPRRTVPTRSSTRPPSRRSAARVTSRPSTRIARPSRTCKNPSCGKTFTPSPGRRGEYCQPCWQDAACTNCGYIAAKWMHDERGGLCRHCLQRQRQARPTTTSSASKVVPIRTPPQRTPASSGEYVGIWVFVGIVILVFIMIIAAIAAG